MAAHLILAATQRLKRTKIFRAVYRHGRWSHGQQLSIGVLPSEVPPGRIGLRTKKNLRGAVVRNRLKRQVRALFRNYESKLATSHDMVVVIHPKTLPVTSTDLEVDFTALCKRLKLLS